MANCNKLFIKVSIFMLTSQKLRLLVNELCCIVPICETYLYDDHIIPVYNW